MYYEDPSTHWRWAGPWGMMVQLVSGMNSSNVLNQSKVDPQEDTSLPGLRLGLRYNSSVNRETPVILTDHSTGKTGVWGLPLARIVLAATHHWKFFYALKRWMLVIHARVESFSAFLPRPTIPVLHKLAWGKLNFFYYIYIFNLQRTNFENCLIMKLTMRQLNWPTGPLGATTTPIVVHVTGESPSCVDSSV